jgi:hypothetical protein
MQKRLCVLQVTPSEPNPDHVTYFENKKNCDFFFVTHDEENPKALKFCPGTTWAETRNLLVELVEKKYDYYALIDYDYILRPQKELGVLEQIIEDLEMNPAVLTYYPGKNLQTPYATDTVYFKSREYSSIPFTHFGLKIIHNSLINWFFPLCTDFSVNIDSCHMFNLQEIPFIKNVICSHKMIYDNGVSDPNAIYNQDGAFSKYKMDEMWKWISSSFKMKKILDYFVRTEKDLQDSLFVKEAFVSLMRQKNITPSPAPSDIDYYNKDRIEKVFDMNHQFFINKNKEVKEQFMNLDDDFVTEVEQILRRNVTFERLKTKLNPWLLISTEINNELGHRRNITMNECVEIFQKMKNNNSLFTKNAKTNPDLWNYLRNKKVAFVGPASYLVGKEKGKLIDSYDVVVRIQPEIWDVKDFGSRTDIIQSCMNSAYSPKVARFLSQATKGTQPKFIICNDTVAREIPHPGSGKWLSVVREYDDYLKQYGVPMAHLKNEDGTWERWALYWEVYAKPHIEKISSDLYTYYSGNFNSGYGALCHLLSCPIKELAVFGVDFYNFGVVRKMEDKYNPAYIAAQGRDGTYLGPDTMLHDQISQIMHCKNVLERDPRFKLDPEIKSGLYDKELEKRINKFKKLPKILHTTQ